MTEVTYPDLAGKLVVITGGGRGIGLATARRFTAQGARVVVLDLANGDSDLEAEFVELDVTDASAVSAAADKLVASLGSPDIVLNAAGIVRSASAEEMSAEDWSTVLDVNLSGTFHVCQAFGRHMLAAHRGTIVNIASMSATVSNYPQKQISYNASKAGVVHLTKTLAGEWADRGVRVNSISPGYIATDLTAALLEREPELGEVWRDRTPTGRLGTPDEVASIILFLASDASSLMTGSDVIADGGYTVW
ncbi:NAD(P)-dependent dehydrogenase (short-subunit alcohol dehydrogenase family) [Microbacterium ginsengiterrae]|uniref:NAD(P)-dependent dehydrogenase (Short-subunit alcohol dehydrogenase family) n=1 Tax=Microbacterium ginsengiterrae TaxID=546115 RepID=A0A7W9CBS2_9MICO|nr:SDR family oxidoreductase [Microbacterium ginsengiterrae]MBB5742521.1 NAD(P)-dependent dehydrogenase (short-subunit alcohol dehydrogenase family) [Microbacterium ginsengiterrae]